MKIYTKTGDKGETGIIGKRLPKNSIIFETLGTLDELNAHIGIIVSKVGNSPIHKEFVENLIHIQEVIFSIGALIAGGKFKANLKLEIEALENEIDFMEETLQPLKNFILPGGTQTASAIHLTRAVCRRAERNTIKLLENIENSIERKEHIERINAFSSDLHAYLNRLSDYFFISARYINKQSGTEEIEWKGK